MNRKVSLGVCISLIIMTITATFAVTMVVSKQVYSRLISNISQRSQTYESVDEINRIVSNYFYGTIEDTNALDASVAEGYINGLGDPASRYLDSEEYASYVERLESGVTGIGVETAFDYSKNEFVITYVYESSPAESAGLKNGDVIIAVNDVEVTRSNYPDVSNMLFGSKLSSIDVKYERDGETTVAEPMLGFSAPSVYGYVDGDVGYVKVNGFYKETAGEFKKLLNKLKENGAESMVFDVRNTSSGSIDYAVQTLDVIIPNITGNLAIARDRNGNVYNNKVYTSESSSFVMPFAVLINGNTSGPAELFACDLRDISQATLIGTKTAGNGTMQELFTLENGGAVLLTVAKIEPKTGAEGVYDEVGVQPTVEVKLNGDDSSLPLMSKEEDNQLSKAVSMLAQ